MNPSPSIPTLHFASGFEPSLVEAVKKSGVVKVFGAIDAETLSLLNGEYEEILASGEAGVKDLGVEVGKACNLVRSELEAGRFSGTVDYFTQPWMQRVSDVYWGDARVLNENIFVTREIPGTKHLAQDLHFDVQETLKFFLYLNDVTAENGAFSCVPGSLGHTRSVREESGADLSYDNREQSRKHPFAEEEVVPVEGGAGTLIVFTTEVWHRAGIVRSGERRVMRGHTRTPAAKSVEKRAREPVVVPSGKSGNRGGSWLQRLIGR